MKLLNLPYELLDEIITQTLPNGFEALSLTCKTIYARVASQAERHAALKRRWRHTVLSTLPGHTDVLHALHSFFLEPLAALYIEELEFVQEGTADGDQNIRGDGDAMQRVRDTILQSKGLQRGSLDPKFVWDIVLAEDADLMAGTLDIPSWTITVFLSFLPNLKTLRLPQTWNHALDNPLADDSAVLQLPLWQGLPEDANNPAKAWEIFLDEVIGRTTTPTYGDPGLAGLETLLPFKGEGYESRSGLQTIEYFLRLESLKNLYLVSCVAVDDGYTGIPFHWRPVQLQLFSSLKRIELAYCCMDAEGVGELLSRVQALEIFKYSHQTKWHGCQSDWNPGSFIESIARYSGRTLTELAITIDELHGDIVNGACSLFFLPRLRKLEVDSMIFRGPGVESGQRRGQDPFVPPGEKPWDEDDIPCIGGMLTIEIEEVQINTDFPEPDERCLNALLKNLREQRMTRLHKLNLLLRQYKHDTAKPIAERAGCEFEVWTPREPEEAWTAGMMPLWKREFNARVGGIAFDDS